LETRKRWYESFLGKFPENPEIVEFPKCEPFNRKFRGKIPGKKKFLKFEINSRGSPLFSEIRESAVSFVSGNPNQNPLSSGKCPLS